MSKQSFRVKCLKVFAVEGASGQVDQEITVNEALAEQLYKAGAIEILEAIEELEPEGEVEAEAESEEEPVDAEPAPAPQTVPEVPAVEAPEQVAAETPAVEAPKEVIPNESEG